MSPIASDGARPVCDEQPVTTEDGLRDETRAAFFETVYNGRAINWRYWVIQMPTLTAGEASRLMSGLDPDIFASLDHRPNSNDPSRQCKRAVMIQRLAERGEREAAHPSNWLAWCQSNGISVHTGYRLAVAERERLDIAGNGAVSNTTEPIRASRPSTTPTEASPAAVLKPAGKRPDSVWPAIELAQSKCRNPTATAEVWPEMQAMAAQRITPFIGETEDGLQYRHKGEIKYFNRDALDKRLHPEKRMAPAKRR